MKETVIFYQYLFRAHTFERYQFIIPETVYRDEVKLEIPAIIFRMSHRNDMYFRYLGRSSRNTFAIQAEESYGFDKKKLI